MASFVRLIDGTIGIGEIESYDESLLTVVNFVEFETWPSDYIEQRYTFKGMYYPFSPLDPIRVTIPSMHVLSVNDDVDNHLLTQYNQYVVQWFTARENMKEPSSREDRKRSTEEMRNLIDALGEYMSETANNTIH